MQQLILRENKSSRIRIFLIVSGSLNFMVGIFFLFQTIFNCGYQFLAPTFAGIFLGSSCIVLQRIQSGWNLKILIGCVVLSIASLGIAIAFIVAIENECYCGYQWCISNSFSSADFLSNFKDNFLGNCSDNSASDIEQVMFVFANFYNKYDAIYTIYHFSEIISVLVAVAFIIVTLSMTSFLALVVLAKKRQGANQEQLIS